LAKRDIIYRDSKFSISYEILNRDEKETIIFLHGWGSSKAFMKNIFSNSFKNYKHIYIDLIGFGESDNPPFPLNSFDYKDILDIFFQKLDINKDMIFGHSFGGKIATLLNPTKLILLSSAGIVEQKSVLVQLKIYSYKLFKNLGFDSILKFMISDDGKNLSKNMYETFKNVVDENFSHIFKSRNSGTTDIFWGRDDLATSLHSGKKINSLIYQSNFHIFEGDHFFFIGKSDEIENLI